VEAIQLLEWSSLLKELFTPELANDLAAFAKAELRTYFREFTDWEREAYLEHV
jgi:glutamine synthetase